MRIWDIHPGYLNRQSLLGEHRELHGIVSILVNGKQGYANHPETRRWVGFGWALRQRHQLLAAEMALRGYKDHTPVGTGGNDGRWPAVYIDPPGRQFHLLAAKYLDKEPGRILLPGSAQQLWSQHKYSVLARDPELYRQIGRALAVKEGEGGLTAWALRLTELLRRPPSLGGLRNALQHMWGHVSGGPPAPQGALESWSLLRLLEEIQRRALTGPEPYLLASTALSELKVWLPPSGPDGAGGGLSSD